MNYDVYGVGNALVDIQAQVSDEVVRGTGFDKGIMTLVDDTAQRRLLDQIGDVPLNCCAGGSAANTIMGIADFGGKVAYAGKVSQDSMGEFFLEDMRKLGVSIEMGSADDGLTGTCVVLITEDAQRTMLTNLGVSTTLSESDIDEHAIAASKYVYIEGYLLMGDSTRQAAISAMELAAKNNVKVALSASDPFLVNSLNDLLWDLIKGPVDLLFCNEEEAKSLTGLDDPIACANEIHKHAANVAMTLGANGSIIMHGGQAFPIEALDVPAIDTTGAGDMYAAGVLYGITNGLSWKQSGHMASAAAARIVSQLGARMQQKFTRAEIDAFMR